MTSCVPSGKQYHRMNERTGRKKVATSTTRGAGRPHTTVQKLPHVSRQALFPDHLLQIPEDNEIAVFDDPPLDHIIQDIYKDIDKEDNAEEPTTKSRSRDHDFAAILEDDFTVETETSSGTGYDRELIVTNLSRSFVHGPVDLDASLGAGSEDDESTANDTITTLGGPISEDQRRAANRVFETIWREHEDEFLMWEDGRLEKTKAKNDLHRALSGGDSSGDDASLGTSKTFDTLGFPAEKSRKQQRAAAALVATTTMPPTEPVEEQRRADPDTTRVPAVKNTVALRNKATKCPSDNATNIEVWKVEQEQEQEQLRVFPNNVRRIPQSCRHTQVKHPSEESVPIASKARQLRAMRLRATTIQDKQAWTKHPVIFEEEKESGHQEYPGHYGETIRVRRNACQSVVSEITNLSDKIFIEVHPKSEAKWDEVSSVGFSVEEQRTKSKKHHPNNSQGCEARQMQEDDDVLPLFDGSTKTPPKCYLDPDFKLKLEKDDTKTTHYENGESKWDDVSSIGLSGVEAVHKKPKHHKTKQGDYHNVVLPHNIPFAVRPRPDDSSSDEDEGCPNVTGIFRNRTSLVEDDEGNEDEGSSEATPTFSTLWRDDGPSGKDKAKGKTLPHLELNPTFSTILVEDCDSYSNASTTNDVVDVEMQAARTKIEVGSTAMLSDSDTDSGKLVGFVPFGNLSWILLTILVVVIVFAVAVIAVYVNVHV